MKQKWIVIVMVVALFATAGFAFGKRGGHGGKGGFGLLGGKNFAELEARLKLTPEQSSQLQAIAQQGREQMKAQHEGNRGDGRQALMKQIFSDNPNQGEINRLVNEMKQEQAAQLDAMVAAGAQANKVLKPQQRAELQQMLDEKAAMRKNMRERMKQKRGEQGSQKQ
jgi:Spy/CpxP family protein refolding chaperone